MHACIHNIKIQTHANLPARQRGKLHWEKPLILQMNYFPGWEFILVINWPLWLIDLNVWSGISRISRIILCYKIFTLWSSEVFFQKANWANLRNLSNLSKVRPPLLVNFEIMFTNKTCISCSNYWTVDVRGWFTSQFRTKIVQIYL